jgi:hypothetical protein
MVSEHIPSTTERVPLHTNSEVNDRIKRDTLVKINYYSQHREEIDRRLKELDREWDTERLLEANASTVVLIGVILGFVHSMYWFILPGIVGFFLLQHAVQGWCPPLPVIRRLGYRTADEINDERIALKCMTGDMESMCTRLQTPVSLAGAH